MTASSESSPVADRPTRRLTWLYVTALSFVALLTIAGQVLTQRSIARQLDDSRIVNLAGRQRMLSQRLTQLALRLERESSPERRRELGEQFSESFAVWTETHAGLRYGSEALSLPENDSDVVASMFAALDEAYLPMERAGYSIREAANDPENADRLSRAIEEWLARETSFLDGMDAIVFQYDAEARDRVAQLRFIEAALLVATLATLAAEATFVFRPAVRRLRDYVERLRSLNAQLVQAERRAVEADEAKTQFLAGMSHELRTPMSAILGAAEISLERAEDPASKRLLAALRQSAESLSGMLDDLLDLASFDAGAQIRIADEPFDVRQAVERIVELFRPSAERKGLSLTLRIEDGFPHSASGDEKRLGQILSNLLSNAIKFTDDGSIELQARSETVGDDAERMVVEVSDTGPGVPPEHAARIFERFARVDSSLRRRAGGAGLGLAISSELARAMSGTLELDRSRRSGSRFVLRLPLRRTNGPGDDSPLAEGAEANCGFPTVEPNEEGTGSPRALIADDSDANRMLLAERMRELGYRITEVANGQAALEAVRDGAFQAILLDVEMPELDGVTVAQRLRKGRPAIDAVHSRLVAVTVHPQEAIRSRCLEAGFDEVLRKPASLADLRQAIRREVPAPAGAGEEDSNASVPSTVESSTAPRIAVEQIRSRFQRREALLVRLIELYLAESAELHERLRSASAANDLEEIARVVHRWKGSCANFGSSELDESFARFESHLSTSAVSPESFASLSEAIGRFETILRQLEAELDRDRKDSLAEAVVDESDSGS